MTATWVMLATVELPGGRQRVIYAGDDASLAEDAMHSWSRRGAAFGYELQEWAAEPLPDNGFTLAGRFDHHGLPLEDF